MESALDHSDPSDAQLMQLVAQGNTQALASLMQRHQHHVLALATRLLNDPTSAEDVAQDVFISVFRAASRYRPDARFTTWLYRITFNRCLDFRRRHRRHPQPRATDPPSDAAHDPAAPLVQQETARAVQLALEKLPDRQRTAVILHRYQNLSHKQIAQVTGWSVSAVESLLVRAYATLRISLADIVCENETQDHPPRHVQ